MNYQHSEITLHLPFFLLLERRYFNQIQGLSIGIRSIGFITQLAGIWQTDKVIR